MITLLRDSGADHPEEYLLARIRGRRAERLDRLRAPRPALTDTPHGDEEAITAGHEAEVHWLYRQLAGQTREGVAPLFVLFELRRLSNWLRQTDEAKEWEQHCWRFLAQGLWHPTLVRQGVRCGNAQGLLALLAERVTALAPELKGVPLEHEAHRLLEVERRLTGAVLVHGAIRGQFPVLRELCRSLIDLCNVLGLVKSWLWKLPALPAPIPAGHLSPAHLARIWREGDVTGVGLPAAVTKEGITPEQIATLEEVRKEAIWQGVRKQARLLDPCAVITDYLCLLEAEAVQRRGQLPAAGL